MTTPVTRSHTVTVRIDTAPEAAVDSTQAAPAAPAPASAPVMSADEYQWRTRDELADDVIVDGVPYSRAEWDRMQDGGQHTTTDKDSVHRAHAAEGAPTVRRAPSVWNGTDAPF
ncbi:hypothetical protein ACFXJO_03525 [Streptomyces lavendulae]|uniref:hypothetical protein n=1 Tax=Streptomyces lavendulae TaxID=1914 RepID=UPI0036A94564